MSPEDGGHTLHFRDREGVLLPMKSTSFGSGLVLLFRLLPDLLPVAFAPLLLVLALLLAKAAAAKAPVLSGTAGGSDG